MQPNNTKLGKRKMMLISFMLFSLFFGAGNLIFPPFMGQNAGKSTPLAVLGFLITAVILPVLGVIAVARFDGLEKLGSKVGKRFSLIFTILIYLSIGPGLGIPRAASVPFEMAVVPYLPQGTNTTLWLFAYSLVFFLVALWLCMTPKKLVHRIGDILTPLLLLLILVLFVGFLIKGKVDIGEAQETYRNSAFLQGFTDGYQTMDTIAALNFGLVISNTLGNFGIKTKSGKIRNTIWAGALAGTILAIVYLMLSYMGMASSNVYSIQENGAWTLRCIVYQVFGEAGAILLAIIFTLACLTTCVGLINSISQYFADLFGKISYRAWVLIITSISFLVCNLGLNMILSISVPVLNAIYPVSIVLILLGLSNNLYCNNRYVYPFTVLSTAVFSTLYAVEQLGVNFGEFSNLLRAIPLYSSGFGWCAIALATLCTALVAQTIMDYARITPIRPLYRQRSSTKVSALQSDVNPNF